MLKQVSQAALDRISGWVGSNRSLKAANPGHRVIIDVCMERMHTPSNEQMVRLIYDKGQADRLLSYPAEMRGVEPSQIWRQIQSFQKEPVGGVGGLGIVGETVGWTANHYPIFLLSLLHTARRVQEFSGNRQTITFVETNPEDSPLYEYLGTPISIDFYGKETPVDAWLFNGFSQGDNFVPDIRLSLNGVTGKPYPRHDSQANFDQMHVLGQAGFKIAQHFGLIGVDDPAADLIIGHDGHTALFKFNYYLWLLQKLKDPEAALTEVRRMSRATIHAPQAATAPQTTGDMVRKHYDEEAERIWGQLGLNPGQKTNALFAEINLSGRTGVVSPVHWLVTQAEETARRRGFAGDAQKLLPDNLQAHNLVLNQDAIAMPQWLGMGLQWVLNKFRPDCLNNPGVFSDQSVRDNLRTNMDFKRYLAEAFDSQDMLLMNLLNHQFPRRFKVEIPERALLFAAFRRGTSYKLQLTTSFLSNWEVFDSVAQELNRPIVFLFGGLAHSDDSPAIDKMAMLLDLIQEINAKSRLFKADFLLGYDLEKAKWIFPGLAKRGCWVSCTNPLGNRSQGTEAFGPSNIKAVGNGAYLLGPDDGGAGCLSHLPTVEIYGPTTFVGKQSFHNDLWGNQALTGNSDYLMANGFLGKFKVVARRMAEDLNRYESGRGSYAPGLEPKIESILQVIMNFNGHTLIESYLR